MFKGVYINLHQTIWAGLAVAAIACYIFDVRNMRTDLNAAIFGGTHYGR